MKTENNNTRRSNTKVYNEIVCAWKSEQLLSSARNVYLKKNVRQVKDTGRTVVVATFDNRWTHSQVLITVSRRISHTNRHEGSSIKVNFSSFQQNSSAHFKYARAFLMKFLKSPRWSSLILFD